MKGVASDCVVRIKKVTHAVTQVFQTATPSNPFSMWSKDLKSSPASAEELTPRLLAAAVLTQAGIPCVVWGEEALSWIHSVPHIFYKLHLLVSENQLEKASQTLVNVSTLFPILMMISMTGDSCPERSKTFNSRADSHMLRRCLVDSFILILLPRKG